MKRGGIAFALAATLVAFSVRAGAADPARLVGAVLSPLELTDAFVATLPLDEIDLSFETGHGVESGHYRGVRLWTLVEKAGLAPLPGKNADLTRVLLVTGRDGYRVALALAEIEPNYENKAVLLVKDGEGWRLLVPGDRHGGRSVRDVAQIELRSP